MNLMIQDLIKEQMYTDTIGKYISVIIDLQNQIDKLKEEMDGLKLKVSVDKK